MKKYIIAVLLVIFWLAVLLPVKKSTAIPAFGRKYRISCQTCHSPAIPALKPYGDEFAGAGFRLEDYESPRYFMDTGDDELSLLRELPLSVRFDGHFSYNNAGSEYPDFGFPYGLKLMSGGEVSEKLSYYFYVYIDERGEVAGVEDAFLMYHDLLGTGINLYAGQFQVSDPLFKRELRLILEDYHIYKVSPGNSSVSLTYDRGILIEYELPTGTGIVAEVVNGNGLGEAGEGILFDKDRYKNYLIRVSQPLGEYFNIGLFGYFGKEELQETTQTQINKSNFFGPDLSFSVNDKFALNVQYLLRQDGTVMTGPGVYANDVNTHGGFVEAIYSPEGDDGKWYFAGLANWVESDLTELNYKTGTIHAGHLLRRNLRIVGEYTYQFEGIEHGRASIGFVSAF